MAASSRWSSAGAGQNPVVARAAPQRGARERAARLDVARDLALELAPVDVEHARALERLAHRRGHVLDARFRNRPSHIRLGTGDDVLFWTNGQNGAFVIDGGPGDDLVDMESTDFAAHLARLRGR